MPIWRRQGRLSELPDRVGRRTIAGDKGFDTKEFVEWTRAMNVTPHVAKNETREDRRRWTIERQGTSVTR
jgi:hypothetical protein